MTAHSAIKRAGGATEDRKRPLGQDPRPQHVQSFFPRFDFCSLRTAIQTRHYLMITGAC